jgi:hypothetical protein
LRRGGYFGDSVDKIILLGDIACPILAGAFRYSENSAQEGDFPGDQHITEKPFFMLRKSENSGRTGIGTPEFNGQIFQTTGL